MKLDDVVKELRSAATFGLLLSAIWLASAGGYVEALRHKAEMKHLMAFLLLKDKIGDRLREDITPYAIQQACPSPRDKNCKGTPVELVPPWNPLNDPFLLTVVPIRETHTFEVEKDNSRDHFPFEYYCFDIDSRSVFHPPTGGPTHRPGGGAPQTSSYCNFDNQTDEPYLWERMRGWLYSQGVTASEPRNISLSDPVISKLAIQYLSPEGDLHQDIAGLPVPIYLAPFVIGALLIVLSSILVGTAAAFFDLRRRADNEASSWVMLYTGEGSRFTIPASVALAFAALAVPVASIVRTWQILRAAELEQVEIDRLPSYVLLTGLAFLLCALIVNLVAQVSLRKILTGQRSPSGASA